MKAKRLLVLFLSILVLTGAMIGITSCDFGSDLNDDCTHVWDEATCIAPKTCRVCKATEGEALGHKAATEGDCETPVLCERCEAMLGGYHEHSWVNATCTVAKHCEKCSITQGAPLGHKDENRDHTCDKNCGNKNVGTHLDGETDNDHLCDYGCGATLEKCSDAEGDGDHACDVCDKPDISGHNYGNTTCDAPSTCSECGKTDGAALAHKDENKDHVCDYECGEENLGAHADENKDHACDYGCNKAFGACEDKNKDHDCDYGCGETFGDCADTDKDHACDYGCNEEFGTCADADKDHACDYGCNKEFGTCVDADKDHACDYGCDKEFGTCADADKDHACDYGCDKEFGTCVDADKDHACDYGCDKEFGTCIDEDKDHACDYGCDKAFGTCVDEDKDHDCDYGCDKEFGTCVDADKDHACDYGCNKEFGTCIDEDKDHACDYGCDEEFGDCVDADKDHECDYGCDKAFGTCVDEDKDHDCDYGCDKEFGECADADKDHDCDYGCDKEFGTCADTDKDHACDYGCDEEFGDCADADKDHDCDYGCNETFGECVDEDKDHACDYGCNKAFGTCADADKDHACDYGCDKEFGTCADADKDHDCDYGCNKEFGTCIDEDKDHACDYGCDKEFGTCADADKDHACDYGCDKEFGTCIDEDKDHACDYGCNEEFGTCADADKDHACDYGCDKEFGTCIDEDKDHDCDYGCDKEFGTCIDEDKDHACDYGCDKEFGTCADADKDHACDYGCDEEFGDCADADEDHDCDYGCDKEFGTCADSENDDDHLCDYGCGATLEDCFDAEGDDDHNCDVCDKPEVSDHSFSDATCDTPATCSECGKTEGATLEHSWVNPTCTEAGYCLLCSATGESARGHSGGNATCDALATCESCGEEYGQYADHKYDAQIAEDAYIATAADCTNVATYYYSCSVCGAADTNRTFEGTTVLGHSFGEWIYESGSHVRSCKTCHTETESGICAYDANSGLGSAATCTAPAVCSVCLHEFGEKLDHAWDDGKITTKPTCTDSGVKTYTCSACGTTKEEALAASGHSFDNGAITKNPTCTEAGVKTFTCSGCNDTKEEPVTAIGHLWNTENRTCEDGQFCTRDDCDATTEPLGHSYALAGSTAATCTEAQNNTYKCSTCGDTYTESEGSPKGHNIEGVEAVNVLVPGKTCVYYQNYQCKDCPQIVTAEETVTNHETWTASITSHATCTEVGEKLLTCAACGETKTEDIAIDNDLGHAWDAGVTADGVTTYTCIYNNEHTKTVKVITSEDKVSGEDLDNQLNVGDTSFELDDGVKDVIGDKEVSISSDELSEDEKTELKLDETLENQIGDSPIYNFTISDGENLISDFNGGKIKVTLPYTLGEGEDVDSIAIWFISDKCALVDCENGDECEVSAHRLVSIKATFNKNPDSDNDRKGFVTFETDHFSCYTVTRLTPKQRCELYGHSSTFTYVAPTCTQDGYTLEFCIRCGYSNKATNPETDVALKHDYKEIRINETCTTDGSVEYICQRNGCNHSYKITLKALNHNYIVSDKADATCAAVGYVSYVCDRVGCDAAYSEVLAQLEHIMDSAVIAPDCENGGYTSHFCTREGCDYSYTDTPTAPIGHDYVAELEWYDTEGGKIPHGNPNNGKYSGKVSVKLVCQSCGDEKALSEDELHMSDELTHPTCDHKGHKKYIVRFTHNGKVHEYHVKDETYFELLGISGHQHGDGFNKFDENSHWSECKCGDREREQKHKLNKGVVTKVATCSEEGERTFRCECGYTKTEVIPKTNHAPSHEWESDENEHWHICTVCDEAVSKSAHKFDGGKVSKAATCAEDGEMTYRCACGQTKTEIIPKTDNHKYNKKDAKFDEYSHWFECRNCHGKCEETAHSYTITQNKAPTCTDEGEQTAVCSCGYSEISVIAALGHSYDRENIKLDAENHWYECTVCQDKTDAGAHTAYITKTTKNPTCLEDGEKLVICSCGYEKTEAIPMSDDYHSYDRENVKLDAENHWFECTLCQDKTEIAEHWAFKTEIIKAATCTEDGEMLVICLCGYEKTEVIPMAGGSHSYDKADALFDENYHWYICTSCGSVADKTVHYYSTSEVTKTPDCTNEGELTHYCECGHSYTSVIATNNTHSYVDGFCVRCGAEYNNVYFLNLVNSWKNIDGFAVKINGLYFEVKEESAELLGSLELVGSIKQIDIAELMLYVEDGELRGAAIGSVVIFNGPISGANAVCELRAVIEDGFIYADLKYGNEDSQSKTMSVKISTEVLVESIIDSYGINEMALMSIGYILEAVIPEIETLTQLNSERANAILECIFNMIFTIEEQADGKYVAELDFDKLYALNENLATKSIAEVVDIYFGEGAFDSLLELATEILGLKLPEIPEYVRNLGLDPDVIIAKINDYCAMIGAPEGFDIGAIIANEEFANMTLGMLVFEAENEEQADKYFDKFISIFADSSLYEMFNTDISAEEIKSGIDAILDMLAGGASVSFTTDAEGMLESVRLTVDGLTLQTGDNEVFIGFELDITVNGKIDVSWSDIVDEFEDATVMPEEGMLQSKDNYDWYEASGRVNYKGTYYYYEYGYNVRIYRAMYDTLLGVMFRPECGDCTVYSFLYARQSFDFTIAELSVDGEYVILLIDNHSGAVVELVEADGGFTAIFESGEEKYVAFDFNTGNYGSPAETYAQIYFGVFDNPEGKIEKNIGYSVEFYYNDKLGEYSTASHHSYEYKYELNGESCEDGYKVTRYCTSCGESEYYYGYGHRTDYREISLSALGLCGGYIEEQYCTVCDTVTYSTVNDYNCHWSHNGTNENGYDVYECKMCGTTKLSFRSIGEKDENCRYMSTEVNIYLRSGEEIYRYERTMFFISHNTQQSYIFDGESCDDGYTVISYCADCSYSTSYRTSGHRTMYREASLSALGLCGGFIEQEYCTICDTVTYSYVNDYDCRWSHNGMNENDYDVYECKMCGTTKLSYRSYGAKNENCGYSVTEIVLYYKDGEEICRAERTYYEMHHNYKYSYELEGESCNDGYLINEYCTECEYRSSWYGSGHRNEHFEINVSEYGCYGFISGERCAICAEISYLNCMDIGCDVAETEPEQFVDENGVIHYVMTAFCNNCGLKFATEQWECETSACESIKYSLMQIYYGEDLIFAYTETYESTNHSFETVYEFNGDDCDSGYKVTAYCTSCGQSDYWYGSGHDVESHHTDLRELGLCGGYSYENVCIICDKVTYSYIEDYNCSWAHLGNDENGNSVFRCDMCGVTRLIFSYNSEKNEFCRYQRIDAYVYKLDDEEIYRFERSEWLEEHDYGYEFKLNGSSCEDGVEVIVYCLDCDYRNSGYHTGHSSFEMERINLSDYGVCGTDNYISVNSCPCGYYFDVRINTGSCNMMGSNHSYKDAAGITHYVYTDVCSDCGFTVARDEYTTPDGCNHIKTNSTTFCVNGTELYSYATNDSYIDHSFELHAVITDGTADISAVCSNCGYTANNDTAEAIVSGNAEITYSESFGKYCCELFFAPEVSGYYLIYSNATWDTYVELYRVVDGKYHLIKDNDDGGNNNNFRLEHYLEAGETYLYVIRNYGSGSSEPIPYVITEGTGTPECDHSYEYQYVLADGADSCTDGAVSVFLCQSCGYINSYHTYYEHNVNMYDEYQLSEFGVCGGESYIRVEYCVCGYITYFNIYNDYHCHTTETHESYTDAMGITHNVYTSVCSDCGLTVVRDEYGVREGCYYKNYYSYTVTAGGTTVISDIRTVTYTHAYHTYGIPTFTFDGEENCISGVTLNHECTSCGYNYNEYRTYHGTISKEYIDLGELGGCEGGYIAYDECPCGIEKSLSYSWNCSMSSNQERYVDSEGVHHIKVTHTCSDCALVLVEDFCVREENCYRKTYISYSFTFGEDNIISTEGIRVNSSSNHSYVYSYEFDSDSHNCEDGVTVNVTCANCDYTDTHYTSYHARYSTYYYLCNLGSCALDSYIRVESCACGNETYYYQYIRSCNMTSTDDSYTDAMGITHSVQTSVCSDCGITVVTDSYTEADGCSRTTYKNYTVSIGGVEIISDFNHVYNRWDEHTYGKPTFTFDGEENCDGGVTHHYECTVCDYGYESHYYGHATVRKEYYDLTEYGACYGYIEYLECACGEVANTNRSFCWSTNNDNSYYDEDGLYHTVYAYECYGCGLRVQDDYISIRDKQTCIGTENHSIIMSIGAEFIGNLQYVVKYEDHDYAAVGRLMPDADSCDEGVIVTYTCRDCDSSYESHAYYHLTYETERYYIQDPDYGSALCEGYFYKNTCACGRDTYMSYNAMCEFGHYGITGWVENAVTGWIFNTTYTSYQVYLYHEAYRYTCAVTDPEQCGYTVRYSTYWLFDEVECRVYQYQTWQFGYDETTDTCAKEITFKTGASYTHHPYVATDLAENWDNGNAKVSGTRYDCERCGSYYYEKYTYFEDGSMQTYDRMFENKLNNGERKLYQEYREYENGYDKLSLYRYIDSDGTERWDKYEYVRNDEYVGPFGDSGYEYEEKYSNHNCASGEYERIRKYAYVNYRGYQYYIYDYYIYAESWEKYDYSYNFVGTCERTTRFTTSDGKDETTTEPCHHIYWDTTLAPTCTQDGYYDEVCHVCESTLNHNIKLSPYDHNWQMVEENYYICSRCGIENINGASGEVVLEDLTVKYGGGENFVAGYWARNNVHFIYYVSLILHTPMEDGNDEIILDNINIFELDSVRALAFSRAAVIEAAEALGYSEDEYYVRFAFVPLGADGSYDYAITFTEDDYAPLEFTGSDVVNLKVQGNIYREIVINPEISGNWIFESSNNSFDVYGELYDEDGNRIYYDDDSAGNRNFRISYYLEEGKTYTLRVRYLSYPTTGVGTVTVSAIAPTVSE